jgi:hypothetical protein
MSGFPEVSRESRRRQTRPPAAMKTNPMRSKADKNALIASKPLWLVAEVSQKKADNVSTAPASAIAIVFE